MKKYLVLIVFCFSICSFAQIITIPDANFKAKLIQLGVDTNTDGEIQENEALQVTDLNVSYSNIVDLTGIGSFLNLVYLNCSNNQLTSADVSNLINLYHFNCGYNQLTSIAILNTPSLDILDCRNNQLTTIDFSTSTYFLHVICSYNLITGFVVNNTLTIAEFDCNNNQISYFDLSKIRLTSNIGNYMNNPITIINAKNDFVENNSFISFLINTPTLQFICADDYEIDELNQQLIDFGFSNVEVNSYCSFTPGGNYNTITGTVTYDLNSDGCDVNDQPKQNIRMNINDGTNQGATFTNSEGNYNFYTNTGSFTITPAIENPTWFTFSPTTATIPFPNTNNNVVVQDFCLSANGNHPDVEIVIAPIFPARPGFTATYQVLIKNKGNFMLSGQFMLNYNDELLDFLDAGIFPNQVNSGSLMWNFADLMPFETRQTNVSFMVNSPTDAPPVNIGDELVFQAVVTPTEGDENSQDNVFDFNQIVVGSFDPNDITCLEGDVVPASEIGEYLHYVINFENTGNSQAENIVVRTDIDAAKFNVNSLQMLNTSHNAYIRQNGSVVEFIFQNIALESGGHGNVLLKIKTKDNLLENDTVTEQANIYFDYNAPIETNVANTTFETLSSGDFEMDTSISVYPNPTTSIININCNNNIKTIQLYDVQGRLLQTQIVNNTTTSIDISDKSKGVYFAKITSEVGVKVEKIMKE